MPTLAHSEGMPARLMLLLDSRSPAGAHSHSGGMEAAVTAGWVRDVADVREFCRGRLAHIRAQAAAWVRGGGVPAVARPHRRPVGVPPRRAQRYRCPPSHGRSPAAWRSGEHSMRSCPLEHRPRPCAPRHAPSAAACAVCFGLRSPTPTWRCGRRSHPRPTIRSCWAVPGGHRVGPPRPRPAPRHWPRAPPGLRRAPAGPGPVRVHAPPWPSLGPEIDAIAGPLPGRRCARPGFCSPIHT